MAYQIYRIGEWERVGGVGGYATIRACLQPGLYETHAYARKKSARLASQDYENGGDGSFEVVAVGESPFDQRRPSLAAWLAAHPHVLDPDIARFVRDQATAWRLLAHSYAGFGKYTKTSRVSEAIRIFQ